MKQIKPCPFCGSENLSVGGFENYIKCKNCGAAGPDGSTLNEAFDKWDSAPRKEDVEMEKNCGSCKYNSENLKYIYQTEPFENRVQQLAEEAAELAQAALKYNRSLGNGCYTPVSRKDAADSLMEEIADVLLCMAAAFPYTERYKDFHVNLERIYKEKETRWTERLKENTKEE